MPLEQAEGSLALLDRQAEQENRARLCRVSKRPTDFKRQSTRRLSETLQPVLG
jgi:hypothetical protein